MLKVDDFIVNGFKFNDDETPSDRVESVACGCASKSIVIRKLMIIYNLSPEDCVSIGDSEMDLSMIMMEVRFYWI